MRDAALAMRPSRLSREEFGLVAVKVIAPVLRWVAAVILDVAAFSAGVFLLLRARSGAKGNRTIAGTETGPASA